MHQLPKQIKHKNKIYRDFNFSWGGCRAYRNGNHVILVEPDGSVFFEYTREENYAREM